MPTTMKLVAKNVLDTTAASVTFSNIPSSYTDLCLKFSARSGRAQGFLTDSLVVQFNGIATGYSARYLYVNSGSSIIAATGSGGTFTSGSVNSNDSTASTFGNSTLYIYNYAGSTNKATWSYGTSPINNSTGFYMSIATGLWSNTSAITSMVLTTATGTNYQAGSTFYLYGIKKI